MAEFERIVQVSGAYDKRHSDPAKNYGVGACRITFLLKGEKGAVQFMIGTDWYVPSARAHLSKFSHHNNREAIPDGWDVGYHSHAPMFDGHEPMEHCDVLEGACYYDGSGLRAQEWIEPFVEGGTDWLWPKLEDEYRSRFSTSPSKGDL